MDKTTLKNRQKKTIETKENVIVPISPKADFKKIYGKNIEGGGRGTMSPTIVKDGKKYLHEPDEEFESCCFKCDKPLCLYIGKFSISVAVLLFCFFMLQNKENSAEFYTGTIAGLLGHYLNTPIAQLSSKKKDDDKKN